MSVDVLLEVVMPDVWDVCFCSVNSSTTTARAPPPHHLLLPSLLGISRSSWFERNHVPSSGHWAINKSDRWWDIWLLIKYFVNVFFPLTWWLETFEIMALPRSLRFWGPRPTPSDHIHNGPVMWMRNKLLLFLSPCDFWSYLLLQHSLAHPDWYNPLYTKHPDVNISLICLLWRKGTAFHVRANFNSDIT